MKKNILILSLILVQFASTYAQENKVFNHLGLGLGVGTTGITIDMATPITKHLDIRAGIDIMPNFKYRTSLNLKISDKEKDADGNDGGAIKTLSKITVYPCMTLRLNGRIF